MVQIKIDQFEGPLDLLLQLIEDQQLDISTLALAKVTEQFLFYIKNLLAPTSPDEVGRSGQEKNPINLADFLVIAAKLLVIKSKSLLPNLDFEIEEEEAAFDLTKQLLLYKKYKEAARYLKKLDLKRHQSWTRDVELSDRVTFLPDPETNVKILAQTLRDLAAELKDIIRLPQRVMKEVVSISEKISHIQKIISEKLETSLSTLLKESKSKTEIIVTFLALLELTKQRIVSLEQSDHFGDIVIKKTNA